MKIQLSDDTMSLLAYHGEYAEHSDREARDILNDASRLCRRYSEDRYPPIIRYFFQDGKLSLEEDWS